jgi:acyl carrier protein
MNPDDVRAAVLRQLGAIAPEADLARLRPDVSFRDQIDIDSMDFLNFVIGLHKELHVDIPERDYPKLATLTGCVNYLTTVRGP